MKNYKDSISISSLDPLQARKWILLLKRDFISGIRIKPNLSLKKKYLGFSFSSNSLGLRGPISQNGKGVILGTSFAMGLTVDNGYNWYDNKLMKNFLNVGLPVGVKQEEQLLQTYYDGSAEIAIVLYFPNFWELAYKFSSWEKSQEDIFSFFNWVTNKKKCENLFKVRKEKLREQMKAGNAILFSNGNRTYHVNTKYSMFEFENKDEFVYNNLEIWENLFRLFKNILIFRIPCKQELVPNILRNKVLNDTINSYEYGWNLIKNKFQPYSKIQLIEIADFKLEDYHPWDVHWNKHGNKKFQKVITQYLRQL